MNKKTTIISVILFIIIIAAILIIAFLPKEKGEKSYTKKETIELISKGFVDGISKKDLEKLMNQKIDDKTMMTGEDAYLLQTPSDKLIKQYNLDNYITNAKSYFKKLETKIKENYSWKFDGEVGENQGSYYIKLKTYSYGVYLSDLEEMTNQLLSRYTLSNENTEVNKYKAKVIAMKLLDSYLDEYIYNGDSKVISITFNSINDDKTKNSLIQYLIDLAGYNNREDEKINTMENNRKTRIAEYINTAISNGTLNKNDILKM
ncbi:unknown [Firmicutes bacterium CAG:822]|nr:unknown [Firmicutes bacterium CAG:822]